MISQLLDLILKREFFPFLLRKTKTEERRADEPSAGKMSASEAVPRGNLRVCVKKTSCLPNDGSRLTDTNLTNKGKSVIGTMKYQFFWQQTSLKAAGGKKNKEYVVAEEDALEKRLIMGANPPQLDLETRRRSFVLEFVSLDIYSEFVFFPQKLLPSRGTSRLLTNSRAPSRRFVTLLTNCFIGSLY